MKVRVQVGVAIGRVAVEGEFVHWYKYSGWSAEYYVNQKACYTGLPNISSTVCSSSTTQSRSELSADLTGMNVEVGVNIVLFISGSHLWKCVYNTPRPSFHLRPVLHGGLFPSDLPIKTLFASNMYLFSFAIRSSQCVKPIWYLKLIL